MNDPTPGRTLRLRHPLELVPHGDGSLGVVTTTGRLLHFNETAARLIRAIEPGCDRESLVDVVVETWNIERDAAARDVDVFLHDLALEGMLDRGAL